jgi:hypothetical protein
LHHCLTVHGSACCTNSSVTTLWTAHTSLTQRNIQWCCIPFPILILFCLSCFTRSLVYLSMCLCDCQSSFSPHVLDNLWLWADRCYQMLSKLSTGILSTGRSLWMVCPVWGHMKYVKHLTLLSTCLEKSHTRHID